jgi:hypothetical protein
MGPFVIWWKLQNACWQPPPPRQTKCGLYSIAGAGFELFAGGAGDQPYRKGDIVGAGDIMVPIVDFEWHNLDQQRTRRGVSIPLGCESYTRRAI